MCVCPRATLYIVPGSYILFPGHACLSQGYIIYCTRIIYISPRAILRVILGYICVPEGMGKVISGFPSEEPMIPRGEGFERWLGFNLT